MPRHRLPESNGKLCQKIVYLLCDEHPRINAYKSNMSLEFLHSGKRCLGICQLAEKVLGIPLSKP